LYLKLTAKLTDCV